MRYKIAGHIIRSENTAKPLSQASGYLTEWLLSRTRVKFALDFGCGRLRYAGCLAARCEHLTLVDSEPQIERVQQLDGTRASIPEFVANTWANARVLTFEA